MTMRQTQIGAVPVDETGIDLLDKALELALKRCSEMQEQNDMLQRNLQQAAEEGDTFMSKKDVREFFYSLIREHANVTIKLK